MLTFVAIVLTLNIALQALALIHVDDQDDAVTRLIVLVLLMANAVGVSWCWLSIFGGWVA